MRLAPDKLELLADTLAIYEAAQLGDLNRTAEELQKVARLCGWRALRAEGGDGEGYLPFARRLVRGA